MDRFEERIGGELTEDDRVFLARYGAQGIGSQALGLFRRTISIPMGLVCAVVLAMIVGTLYAFWHQWPGMTA